MPSPTRPTASPNGSVALVSVIVPVWNVQDFLAQCLDSVLQQSIGLDALEIIAVDDGSTDESAVILDQYAAEFPQVIVVHEPNSGGPGRPRNIGLDLAEGTYVFFLDADDYLGPDALRRMTQVAEQEHSDVVLGKVVGVGGRAVPTKAFRRTLARAELADVYSSLSVLKLFRRSLIEDNGLRFPEAVAGGEDAPFTMRAYFAASVISVVADYDCYFYRLRQDSQTTSGWKFGAQLDAHLARMAARAQLLESSLPPGPTRDRLMLRHIEDLLRPFKWSWVDLPVEDRVRTFDLGRQYLLPILTPELLGALPAWSALRAYCISEGRRAELEDICGTRTHLALRATRHIDGRLYIGFPHFRDDAQIPDQLFDITDRVRPVIRVQRIQVEGDHLLVRGTAYLKLLGGSTTLVLRETATGQVFQVKARRTATPHLRDRQVHYQLAGFDVDLDLAAAIDQGRLAPGTWNLHLLVGPKLYRLERPLVATDTELPAQHASLTIAPDRHARLMLTVPPLARPLHTRLLSTLRRARRSVFSKN